MTISIYQPRYFPQLHYYNRALSSDVFVLLDSAQYTKSLVHKDGEKTERHKSFQSDTPIKLPSGQYLLTVPLKNSLSPINETLVDKNSPWQKKHLATLKSAYMKSPYFMNISEDLTEIFERDYSSLAELNIATFLWGLAKLLGLKRYDLEAINEALKDSSLKLKRVVLASQLISKRPEGIQKGTEWTVNICKELGATEYIHGGTAQAGYMDENFYKENGIALKEQDWKCREYHQNFGSFIPNLSIIDLLANTSPEEARKILYEA